MSSEDKAASSFHFDADLDETLARTEAYIEAERYAGYDPYDGLTSPLFRLPFLRRARRLRWAFQQVLKRLPLQVRPVLGIAKGYNPVTLGLVLQAYVYRYLASGRREAKYRERAAFLISELERLATPGFSGACWGYDFDWEARYASIPAHHPTIVATGFITNALYEAHRHLELSAARDLLIDAVPFVRDDLHRTHDGDTFCWSYSPTDRRVVLNATMKGARFCAQASELLDEPSLLDLARATIRFVMDRQATVGSWPYAVHDPRAWADNFHTCYILDCLDEYERITGDTQFQAAKQRGWEYYRTNFFTVAGAAKYYDRQTYPIDATSCAQAILTLTRFGDIIQARQVAGWCLEHLSRPDGTFKYQIHHWYENRLSYMRWSIAWMFLALSRLSLRAIED